MGVKSKDRVERKQYFSFNTGSSPVLAAKSLNKFLHYCINEVDSSESTANFNPLVLIYEGFVIFVNLKHEIIKHKTEPAKPATN